MSLILIGALTVNGKDTELFCDLPELTRSHTIKKQPMNGTINIPSTPLGAVNDDKFLDS